MPQMIVLGNVTPYLTALIGSHLVIIDAVQPKQDNEPGRAAKLHC